MNKELLRREQRRSAKRKHFAKRAFVVLVTAAAALGWAGAILMR